MLTEDENQLFMRTGPGTPMGDLLRRYWHPVGCSELVGAKPQRVKVLGEDLLLYRAEDGTVVLMELRCAHRRVALDFGRIEGDCIRCPYHGWLYNRAGQCIEQPAEPEGSTFKEKVKLSSYRTQELSGLVFAYMGPDPAPLLPLYDVALMNDGIKEIVYTTQHTNWLAHVENIVDISHLAWLHGFTFPAYGARKLSYHWDRKSYGLDNVLYIEGLEESHTSCYGFPTVNRFSQPPMEPGGEAGRVLLFRVPIDDESVGLYFVRFFPSKTHSFRTRTRVTQPGVYAPLPSDWWGIDIMDQDRMAMEQQGVMADRTQERLGVSDGGIIAMRQMMRDSLELIAGNSDPLCIIRNPDDQTVVFDEHSPMIAARQEGVDYTFGATTANV